jgi:hypothetical protein
MWKIGLGLVFGAVDVLLLAWLVGARVYDWFAAGLMAQ